MDRAQAGADSGRPARPERRPDLHRVTLRFKDSALEQAYQHEGLPDALAPFRVAGILAILVFAIVAAVSLVDGPVPAAYAVPGSLGMIVVVALALVIGRRVRTLDALQVVGGLQNVAAGLVAVGVPYLAGELDRYGPQTVGLSVLWAFVVLRLRFAAAVLSVAVYVLAFTALLLVTPAEDGLGLVLVPLYSTVVALGASAWLLERSVRRGFFDRRVIAEQRHALAEAKAESDRLLLNVLPAPIADRLKRGDSPIAEGYDEATVLFADLVGFTPFAEARPPEEVVAFLDGLFTAFDGLSDQHGLEKIKTIGDAYMAVAGLPVPAADHAARAVAMAVGMQAQVEALRQRSGMPLHLRIGIHSGRVVAGVIGRRKFSYDLWGDTVNLASRLEASGLPDRIQVSADTRRRLGDGIALESRGRIEVKGKGRVETWLVVPAP
jgi:class 3 adenylate cyclase